MASDDDISIDHGATQPPLPPKASDNAELDTVSDSANGRILLLSSPLLLSHRIREREKLRRRRLRSSKRERESMG